MKRAIVFIAMVFFAGGLYAGMADISVSSGYLFGSMDDMNNFMEDVGENVTGAADTETNLDKSAGGFFINGDISVLLSDEIMIIARGGYYKPGQAQVEVLNDTYGNTTTTLDFTMAPVMAGLGYKYKLMGTPIILTTKALAGYSFAYSEIKNKTWDEATEEVETGDLSGGGFAADFEVGVSFEFSENFRLGAAGGYRVANVPELTANNEINWLGIPEGGDLSDAFTGTVVEFDLSGFTAALEATIMF